MGIGKACINPKRGGVSKKEIKEIVDLHNEYRRRVARGLETRGKPGPQPSSSNMKQIFWDGELAVIAQRWADQCQNHMDYIRGIERVSVGQSTLLQWSDLPFSPDWKHAITTWYNEVSEFNKSLVRRYRHTNLLTYHYTQMVWGSTFIVGCGMRAFSNKIIYVCNYGRRGNDVGFPVYAIGNTCGVCPLKTECIDYLCAPKNVNLLFSQTHERSLSKNFKSLFFK